MPDNATGADRDRAFARLDVLPLDSTGGGMSSMRWIIVALLFSGTAINYIDRLVIGILGPELQKQYHISDISLGKITAAFSLTYALGQAAAGNWLDRIGTRIGYAVALCAWSTMSMLHAVARTGLQFGIIRSLLGVSESPAYPAAVKTIAEWLPRRERALAMGFVNAGCNVGMISAPAIVGWLTGRFGWQAAFIGTGALGFIWVAFWLPLYRRPHEHPRCSPKELEYINSDASEPSTKVPWLSLFTYPQAWAFLMGKFLTDPIWGFYMFWLPKFFSDRHKLSLSDRILPLTLAYGMAGVGSIVGGWLSSSMIKNGWSINAARKISLFLCACCVIPIVFAAHVSGIWSAAALVGIAMAAHQGFSSNLYTLVSDMFPRRVCASVAGLGGTFGYLGASLFAVFTGYVLQHGHQDYTALFVIAGSAYLLSFAAIQILAPRLTPAVVDAPLVSGFSPILPDKAGR